MSRKFGTNIDLMQNSLLQARLENLAAAPSSPQPGQVWFDSTNGKFMFRTASGNVDPTARANHSGVQPASSISDLAAVVKAYTLDSFAAAAADVNINTHKLINVLAGSASLDAVNYAQLQAVVASIVQTRLNQFATPNAQVDFGSQKIVNLQDGSNANDGATFGQLMALVNGTRWKTAARVIAITPITLSGLQTIDTISVQIGDRVIVAGQGGNITTPHKDNGIWIAASGAWTRAPDAGAGQLGADSALFVEEGSAGLADTQWRIVTNGPITVGTTLIQWSQFGAAVNYSNGYGLNLSGTTFSLDTTVGVRKFAQDVPTDGTTVSFPMTHGLGTMDVTAAVFLKADGSEIDVDIVRTNPNVTTLGFGVAPAAGGIYRFVAHG